MNGGAGESRAKMSCIPGKEREARKRLGLD